MNLFTLVFGEKPRRVITAPPANAYWKSVRATADHMPVRARCAEADCVMETGKGRLKAREGEDYIISYGHEDHAVIRKDVFEATYEPVGEDLYRKRTDVVFRYFTLPYACTVETLEGPQRANPGDWIMQGVEGELWPIPAEKAETKYGPA